VNKIKPYKISKQVVLEAFRRVKANGGAAGVDRVSLEKFESNLKNNLYTIWNRMSSGSYFPPPVQAVEIPKKSGGTRLLGVPTVADRVAQMVAKIYFEPCVEPYFHRDSYGYRPGKSAMDALAVTRQRCWKYDWVLEFDIKGLFDNINHDLLMKAVRKHMDNPWLILYIQRWLEAPIQMPNKDLVTRTKGTPQGGVISPVLANLFLHYTFDKWMEKTHPDKPFARYADDAVAHCHNKMAAEQLKTDLETRLRECGLELHPVKTRIVYCKDDNRRFHHGEIAFDFLGYTFQPRRAKNREGKYFISFIPGASNQAKKAMRQTIRSWRIQLKSEKTLEDLSKMFNPVLRGWDNYYGRYYKAEMHSVYRRMNRALMNWAMRKYKRFRQRRKRALDWLNQIAKREPSLFVQWEKNYLSWAG
jgi:RNA-directed DNA polymerase